MKATFLINCVFPLVAVFSCHMFAQPVKAWTNHGFKNILHQFSCPYNPGLTENIFDTFRPLPYATSALLTKVFFYLRKETTETRKTTFQIGAFYTVVNPQLHY